MKSALPGFYRLSIRERRAVVAERARLSAEEIERLAPGHGLIDAQADRMIENAIGVYGLPLGLAVNLQIAVGDEPPRDVVVPMAIEEPSVLAACSFAAKLLRASGGVRAEVSEPLMVGQIQVMDCPDPLAAGESIAAHRDELIELANSGHPRLVGAGGGVRDVEVRNLAPLGPHDPCGPMLIVHLIVDVRDAMGANAINTMCERLAPRITTLTRGRVGLRILSNLSDQRLVRVSGSIPFSAFEEHAKAESGELMARRIEEASVFAERCPYRAATHNKGVMNGVDAVLVALGQDWRAVEAGAHAFATRSGRYTALATWRVRGEALVGTMELPMAVGTVGGIAKVHPLVQIGYKIAEIENAADLAAIVAAAGLAQNLAALRALAAEGIQSGHMRMHARNIAVEAGAIGDEIPLVAEAMATRRAVNSRTAQEELTRLRAEPAAPTPKTSIIAPRQSRTAPKRPPVPPVSRAATTSNHHLRGISMTETRTFERQPHRDLNGKVFVTGSAGHLGANLVRRLLADGREVRVLLRERDNNAALDGLPVEKVYGDLRDREALTAQMQGCQLAYHCAAMISTVVATPELEREIFDCNVIGTHNLLRAARENGYQRVVVTGSFSAVGYDPNDPSRPQHEEDIFYPFDDTLPYGRTKVQVEHEVLKACVDGLDAVIATSCAILGPNDYLPSRMGQTLIDFAHGRLRAYPPGGFDFVAARDLCEGHVLAMHRGRTGQKYIISTEFATVDKLMDIFEEVTGRPRPAFRIPGPVMQGIANASSVFYDNFAPNAPRRFTPAAVRLLRSERHADTTKARQELGFEPTSIRTAIHEAYNDFARRGLVPSRPGTVGSTSDRKMTPSASDNQEDRARAASR